MNSHIQMRVGVGAQPKPGNSAVTQPASRACRCQAHYAPAATIHYPPGYEMVAPKLRPERANAQRQPQFAAMSSASDQQAPSGRALVMQLIEEGQNTYTNTAEMKAAVTQMESENPSPVPKQRIDAGEMQGVWKVFHAPHISNMSQVLGAKFDPIIYRLGPNNSIVSNVRFTSPLGVGWLSAAGSLKCVYDSTVELEFERFWVDWGEDKLREEIVAPGSQQGDGYMATGVDQLIGNLGKAAFFPQFARFPVHYLDNDLTVFEFTPLSSKISARRVS